MKFASSVRLRLPKEDDLDRVSEAEKNQSATTEIVTLSSTRSPLFSYRYHCSAPTRNSLRKNRHSDSDSLRSNPEPKTTTRKTGSISRSSSANANQINYRNVMTDLALLPIDAEESEKLRNRIAENRKYGSLKKIKTLKTLRYYSRPNKEIKIVIKNIEGSVVGNPLTVTEQLKHGIPHHLLFELNDSR